MNLLTTTGYSKLVSTVARLKHDLVLDVELNSVEYRDATVQHGKLYGETRQQHDLVSNVVLLKSKLNPSNLDRQDNSTTFETSLIELDTMLQKKTH